MPLQLSTPALLFPAVSLLFLAYTNRFLHLAALVRTLHRDWIEHRDDCLLAQIDNLRRRLVLIRWMQILGAASLLLSVLSMLSLIAGWSLAGTVAFGVALVLMALSLASLLFEIIVSGGALKILLDRMEKDDSRDSR